METRPRHSHELLEDALLRVRDVVDRDIDRAELLQLIASSLHQHYRALASGGGGAAYADAMVVASLEIERAIEMVPEGSSDPVAAAVRAELLAATDVARHAAASLLSDTRLPSAEQGWRGPRASVGAPVLLDPPREIVIPAIPVRWRSPEAEVDLARTPEPPRIASLAELDALMNEVPSSPAKRPPRPSDEARRGPVPPTATEQLETTAATLIEELGVLGLLRRQLDGQTWTGKQRAEQRLLARVDAIAACGSHVFPKLVRKLEQRPVPDAELTWGLLYLFGSIAGDDMIDEAMRLARASSMSSPDVREAIADAFATVPNVRVEPRLRAWLASDVAHERAIALHALGRRGAVTADEVGVAVDDGDLSVVREAALAIASAAGRVSAIAIDRLLHHDDELVVQRALVGSVLRYDAVGCRRARALVRDHRGSFGRAALIYALTEGRDALEDLLEDAAVSGSPVVLAALGWFGHVGALPYLIGRLESDDEATRASAAGAIARIAGAHDERDAFPHSRPRMPHGVHDDPKTWRAWWRRCEHQIDAKVRYRFGAPWRASTNLVELEHDLSTSTRRSFVHLELVARLGIAVPFDTNAFVANQRIQIELIRERASLGASGAGGWPVHIQI